MRKILLILCVFAISCKKEPVIPIAPIDLGKPSSGISYNNYPKLVDGVLVIDINTSVNSKYSIQLTNINDDVILSKGLTASNDKEIVNVSVKDIPVGLYNISIINIAGDELKSPILIKN